VAPSPQQLEVDVRALYIKFARNAKPLLPELLLKIITVFAAAYRRAGAIQRTNEAYFLFLDCCLQSLIAFHKAAPKFAFVQEPSSSLFTHRHLIDVTAASRTIAAPFATRADDFMRLGMYTRDHLYPQHHREFHWPEPIFTEREPIKYDTDDKIGWQYEKRDYREAKAEHAREHKQWLEEKKKHDKWRQQAAEAEPPESQAYYATPLLNYHYLLPTLELVTLPLEISEDTRFAHMWIVADSGHGKTQLFQRFIAQDLPEVAAGKRSIVVIDSQNKFIPTIAKLKLFAPGQPLHDRLVVLNPEDIDLALNLFDISFRQHSDDKKRQGVINSVLELYGFMFSALLDREMTGKQRTLFEYAADLLFHVPGATIRDFRALLRKGGIEPYRQHIADLDEQSGTREFFERDFDTKEYYSTKDEVLSRLATMLRNPTFNAMFSQKENRFDMLAEMNAGKVILINTSDVLLKERGVKFLGRFFLAMLGNAVAERANMPDKDKTPTYVYIDEAYEYIKDDANFVRMLARARKEKIGLAVAHQWLEQLNENVYQGLAAIASTVIAARVSPSDAHKVAQIMNIEDPLELRKEPKFHFHFYVKDLQPTTNPYVEIQWGLLENYDTMTEAEYALQKRDMRRRYGVIDPADLDPDTYPNPEPEDYDYHWVATISPRVARDGGTTEEHGFIITIPKGFKSGTVLRFRGKGRMRPDCTYGDAYIKCNYPDMPQQDTFKLGGDTHKKKGW